MLKKLWKWFGGKRSLENPSLSLTDPAAWDAMGLGGGTSAAGVSVNADTAMRYDAVWRAVSLIAGSVSRIKLLTYKQADRYWELDKQHPAYRLLRRGPMPEMTARVFKQTITADAVLRGAGYAYIQRDGSGAAMELWPLQFCDVLPLREYPNGIGSRPKLWYGVKLDNRYERLPASSVLCIMGLSPDGWSPYSVFDRARDSIGLGLAQGKFTGKFFSNNAEPRVLIEVPAGTNWKQPAQEEFLRQWNTMHQGLDNAHRTAILTGGAQVKPYSISAKDAMLIDSRKFSVVEISNWFGVPPHKLGNSDRAAYNSLEQENQSFLDDGLEVWFQAWEEECELKLLANEERDNETHKIEFLRKGLIRAPMQTRFAAYSLGINSRVLNPNECRAEEGMPPYDGGDDYIVAKNMYAPGGDPKASPLEESPAEEPTTDDPPPDPRSNQTVLATHRELLTDAYRRAIRRIGKQIQRAAGKPESFLTFLDSLKNDHEAVVREMIQPAEAACNAVLGISESRTEAIVAEMFRTIHADLLRLSGECTRSELSSKVETYLTTHETHGPEVLAELLIRKSTILEGVLK